MSSQGLKSVLKDFKDGIFEKKTPVSSSSEIDSASALQTFLNHIPVESIPRIRSTQAVEIKSDECVGDAIKMLYEKNVFGAPIVDALDVDVRKFRSPYIGIISYARMVLWSLEEYNKIRTDIKGENYKVMNTVGYFSMLEKIPCIGLTKVGELTNSYIWDPFFFVHLDDALFHVLLLLSKHHLQVVPVIERSSYHIIGFVTQGAVIEMLLQCSGLEWFDDIANKALPEFRFENDGCPFPIYGDQSIMEAFRSMWENKRDQIAVLNRKTTKLIGVVRIDDLHILWDDDEVLFNRMSLKVEDFLDLDARESYPSSAPTIDQHLGPKNKFTMTTPVTNKKNDTLKQVMEVLVEKQSNYSFLVNDCGHVKGEVTMRDILVQFSPPLMDSKIDGGGFFQFALEQTGH